MEEKEETLLSPILDAYDDDQRFNFISALMDFTGGFLIRIIDSYNLELNAMENAIGSFQGNAMNRIRMIRDKVEKARQDGMFKEKAPSFTLKFPAGGAVPVAGPVADEITPPKKKEPTKEDVSAIASEIRSLIMKKKPAVAAVDSKVEGTTGEEMQEDVSAPGQPRTIDSTIQQYVDAGKGQKQRLEAEKAAKPKPAPSKKKTVSPARAMSKEERAQHGYVARSRLPSGFKDDLIASIKKKVEEREETDD